MKMVIRICILIALIQAFVLPTKAQVVKYYVQLSDKNDTVYSISKPGAFLSQRALDRRINQHIKIIQNDVPVDKHYVQQIAGTGVAILCRTRWLNGLVISTNDSTKITKIKSFPFVVSMKRIQGSFSKVENDSKFAMEVTFPSAKTVPFNAAKATLAYNYGTSFSQVNMLGGVALHNNGFSGKGIVIAVLDAGFKSANTLTAFDSLRKNKQIIGTWDFVSQDSMVYEDDEHGMNVLSCMAGNIPGQLIGTAPKANYYLFRTEDASAEYIGEEYYWIAGAEYADSVGVDIISSSLGYNTFDDATQNHSYPDLNGKTTPIAIAATIASRKGILVLVSAGNEGTSSWKKILSPADADSIIAVGAVDGNKIRSDFSSMGPSSDSRVKPTVAAQGSNVVVAALSGGTQSANGTSFSCPLMAGMAACIWQSQRTRTNIELYNLIKKSADHFLHPDSLTGYGIPDFYKIFTGVSEQFTPNPVVVIAPNPFLDLIQIQYSGQHPDNFSIDLIDENGRILRHFEKQVVPNMLNEIVLTDTTELPYGFYCLRLNNTSQLYHFKLVKL
jgi:serine protease AprX